MNIKLMISTFKLIKTVSDTVFDMINAVSHDKPLMFIGATFWEKFVSHHQAVSTFECIKNISDTVFDMIILLYHNKPLFFVSVIIFCLQRQTASVFTKARHIHLHLIKIR